MDQAKILDSFTLTFLNRITKTLHAIATLIVLTMLLLTLYAVAMRYLFNSPLTWSLELVQFMLVAMGYLSFSYVQSQRMHVGIEFALTRLSDRKRAIVGIITSFCALILFSLILYSSFGYSMEALHFWELSEEAHIPVFPSVILVPIGSFVMCLQVISDLLNNARRALR
ncbi:TRAP transporter small permease [Chloroflexota bacterium]